MKHSRRQTRHIFTLLLVLGLVGGAYLSSYLHLESNESLADLSNNKSKVHAHGNSVYSTGGLNGESRRIAALTKTMQRARDIGISLNAPMEFYGRVVDQDGKPVQGVTAKLIYIYYNAIVLATYEPHTSEERRVTDQSGEFSFTGKKGVTLTVRLEPMKGIRFGENGYWSHSFQSDKQSGITTQPTAKERPFIFPAFRLGAPAQLTEKFIQSFLQPDGRTYQVFLREGEVKETGQGDLQISVWQKGTYGKPGTSWGINIKGDNGLRLLETDDAFLYRAPKNGYGPFWNHSWEDGEKDYNRTGDFKFWVKRGDFYGAIQVQCVAFFKDEFRLIIRSSLNQIPDDSNLQPVLPDWPPNEAGTKK